MKFVHINKTVLVSDSVINVFFLTFQKDVPGKYWRFNGMIELLLKETMLMNEVEFCQNKKVFL